MTRYRKIEGFPNYLACSDGYVVNSDTGAVIKGYLHKVGYTKLTLYTQDHKPKHLFMHRVIASAFCEREADQNEVNHKDGNKRNNRAKNLEWVTRNENLRHAYENGLMPNKTVHRAVIATDIETGEETAFSSIHSASKITGISRGNICTACNGKRPYASGFYWRYKEGE